MGKHKFVRSLMSASESCPPNSRPARARRLGSAVLSAIVTISMVLSLWPAESVREAWAQAAASMAAQDSAAEPLASAPQGGTDQDGNAGKTHANDVDHTAAANQPGVSGEKAETLGAKTEASERKSDERAPAPMLLERSITVGEEPGEGEPDRRRTYSVRLTYDAGAGLPGDVELSVSELEATAERGKALRDQLGLEEGDRMVAERYLGISLTSGGQAVQPEAPVEIVLETKELDPTLSDAVEAVVLGDRDHAVEVKNLTGGSGYGEEGENVSPEATRLTLTTSRLGEFGLAAVVRPFDEWSYDGQTISLLGPRAGGVEVYETLHEGESVDDRGLLRTVSFRVDPAHAWQSALWVESHLEGSNDAAGGAVACFRVGDGHLADEVLGAAGTSGPVEISSGGEYAFVLEGAPDAEGSRDAEGLRNAEIEEEQDEAERDAEAKKEQDGAEAEDLRDAEAKEERDEVERDVGQGEPAQPAEGEPGPDSDPDPDRRSAARIDEAEAVSEVLSLRRTYTASDGRTYRIAVGCDDKASIPANAELAVSEIACGGLEYLSYVTQAANVLDTRLDAVAFAKALDVTLVDPISGEEIQPREDVKVLIELLDADLSENGRVGVVHFGEIPEAMDATVKGDAVTFESDGFSVYVVLQTVKETILTSGDGNNYKVTVTYDTKSGIPAGAELVVAELAQDDPQYATYVEGAAETLGKEARHLAYAHAFDISLVDPKTGEHYQPAESVRVSIELFAEDVEKGDSVKVVHFGEEPEVLESKASGKGVEFVTDGFSLFIVAKEKLLKHFVFYSEDDDGTYYTSSEQVLADEEKLEQPADPTSGGAVFEHWSSSPKPDDTPVVKEDTFKEIAIDEADVRKSAAEANQVSEDEVTPEQMQQWLDDNPTKFYAVFQRGKVVVTLYNQSGHVYRRGLVDKGSGTQLVTAGYEPIQNKEGTVLSFEGWVTSPQGTGEPVTSSTTFNEDTDLYPKLTEGHYLRFDSNREDASTIEALIVPVGSYGNISESAAAVLNQLNARPTTNPVVPTAEGYVFTGWYIRASDDHDFDTTNPTQPVFKLNAEGKLNVNADEFGKLLNPSHNLPNSPTLYAHWVKAPESTDPGATTPSDIPTTASYTILLWAQSSENVTKYEFVRYETGTASIGANFSDIVYGGSGGTNYANGLGSGYEGFRGTASRVALSSSTVQADGSSLANVFYNRKTVTLSFQLYGDGYDKTESNDGTQYGLVNGTYVALTRNEPYDDGQLPEWDPTVGEQSNIYSYYTSAKYTEVEGAAGASGSYYVIKNGTYSENPVSVTYDNADPQEPWKDSDGQTYPSAYTKDETVKVYTGARYEKSDDNSYSETGRDGKNLYGWDSNGNYIRLSAYRWTYSDGAETKNYTGTRYVQSGTPGWHVWKTLTGLSGQTLAQNDAEWPSEKQWYSSEDGSGNPTGNRVQVLERFPDADCTYYGKDDGANPRTVTFYKQDTVNSENYSKANSFKTASVDGGYELSDSVYYGFAPAQYRVDSTDDAAWHEWTDGTGAINYNSTLEIRFDRNKHTLKFDNNYTGADPNNNAQHEISYGVRLEDRVPQLPAAEREGYHFNGWYWDRELHQPLTEEDYASQIMPDENVTFYAGWTVLKNMVVLVPNGGELSEGKDVQFYLNLSGEKVPLPSNPSREYVEVDSGEQGEYNYDPVHGRYELAETVTAETKYIPKANAFRFLGWFKVPTSSLGNPVEVEYSPGKYALAYGTYEDVGKGKGPYKKNQYDGYCYVGEGKGDYAFKNAAYSVDKANLPEQYDGTTPVSDPTILVAKWDSDYVFRVKYNTVDPEVNNDPVTAPEDNNEYVENSQAIVLPAATAPDGYTLDHWTDQQGNELKSNDLVSVTSDNAKVNGSEKWVTLTAHYRTYESTERDIGEFTFMKPMAGFNDPTNPNYGQYEIYDVQRIAKGETLAFPATPDAPGEGYVFRGWFYDKNGHYPFRDFKRISNPTFTILYARFEKTLSVNYYLTETNGTGDYDVTNKVLATQTYDATKTDQKMDSRGIDHPVDADHYVYKWVADQKPGDGQKPALWQKVVNGAALTAEEQNRVFDYKSVSDKNVPEEEYRNLYAVLKVRKYVVFDSQGGSFVANQEISETGIPERPVEPTKDGFDFAGWYSKPEGDPSAAKYEFDKKLEVFQNESNFDGKTLYAHWTPNTNARGTLHVMFWAQTADRDEDDSGDTNFKHYQMLYSLDLEDSVLYGTHTLDDMKEQLGDYLANNQYDIVKTVQKGWDEEKARNKEGAATAFVKDVLGYKGNNADVIQNYRPEKYINELNNYYVFAEGKSDGSVVVDGSGGAVLNIRFDLRTFEMKFQSKFPSNNYNYAEIHYKDQTYNTTTSQYSVKVWLNRSLTNLWPVEDAGLTESEKAQKAYLIWRGAGMFYSWDVPNEHTLSGKSITLGRSTILHRAPISLADKLIIDTILDAGGTSITLTPNRIGTPYTTTAVIHYLIRDGDRDKFTELVDLRTTIKVPNRTKTISVEPPSRSENLGNDYWGVPMNKCLYHTTGADLITSGSERFHKGVKYTYYSDRMLPASLSGYQVIDNETVHAGDLLKEEGSEQDDGQLDGLNTSDLYNLVFNRVGRPQAICDTDDPTYINYFASHPDQYVDDVYNFYFYYKPNSFTLKLYLNTSTEYGTETQTFYGKKLSDLTLSGKNTAGLPGTDEMKSYAPAGYKFGGWATSPFQSDPNAAVASDFTMPAYNLTLYAIWEPVQYTVTTWGVDTNGHEIATDSSATYLGNYGQKLRELLIPNAQAEGKLFQGWLNHNVSTKPRVTGMHILKSDLTIEPEFTSLEPHRVTYYAKKDSDTSLTVAANAPVPEDNNQYIEGAKAIVKDGIGLTATRKDINGTDYDASFTCWEDADGNRYYPNDSYTMKGEDLKLYACYSEYRETKLIYHTGDNGSFVNSDGTTAYAGNDVDGTIVVYFRDWLRSDFNSGNGDMIPNHQFIIGKDQRGNDFTVKLNDSSNSMVLAGWSTEPNGPVVTRNGDKVYVNTLTDEEGKLKNELWPVWGICKVVDGDKREYVFRTITSAVDFIETNGQINGQQVGKITGKTGKVEMLVDYDMKSETETQVAIPAGTTVTLTTAGKWGTAPKGEMVFYNGAGDRGTIKRGTGNTTSLFAVEKDASFTTQNIILDGGATFNDGASSSGEVPVDGGIVTASGTLTIGEGTTMQYSAVSSGKKGGAVYVSNEGTLTVSGTDSNRVDLNHCQAHGGGAVFTGEKIKNDSPYDGLVSMAYCSFIHCYAKGDYDDGGTCAGGALRCTANNLTLNNCIFEDCTTVRQGGAIYHRGSTEFYAKDCVFTSCKAGVSTTAAAGGAAETQAPSVTMDGCKFNNCASSRNAGAVNLYYSGPLSASIQSCTFTGCVTETNSNNESNGTSGFGFGGALRSYGTSGLTTIKKCVFSGCRATWGGAVSCFGNVTLEEDTGIANCNAQKGGGVYLLNNKKLTIKDNAQITECNANYGGGVYLNSGTFELNGGAIQNCKAVTSGGGAYLGGGTFKQVGGTIKDCTATEGGGVSLGGTPTVSIKTGSSAAIVGCKAKNVTTSVVNNYTNLQVAENAGSGNNGGGIHQMNGKLTIEKEAIEGCEAYDGGGIYLGGENSTLELSGKVGGATDETKNKAANDGGGIYQVGGKLTINAGAAVTGNEAIGNGGGIYLGNGTCTFAGGIIGGTTGGTGNTAKNGGGIYQGGGTMTIGTLDGTGGNVQGNMAKPADSDDDEGGLGGGIYLGGGSFTLKSGEVGGLDDNDSSVGGNTAKKGGGLYVGNGTAANKPTVANIQGGKLAGNYATEIAGGGGIAIGGPNVQLLFEGNIQVWGNAMPEHNNQTQCDVCLSVDSNEVIRTTKNGLKEDSHIGVYVTDDVVQSGEHEGKELHRDLHGTTGLPFGTFDSTPKGKGDAFLNRFINNRTGTAYHGYEYYYGVRKPDSEDAQSEYGPHRIYWADYVCEITDADDNLLFTNAKATAPALYQYLDQYGAFEALRGHTRFYTYNEETKKTEEYRGNEYYVRMLVFDYALHFNKSVQVPANGKITLTMAPKNDENLPQRIKDEYERHNGCTTIRRGVCNDSVFKTDPNSDFTLANVTVDGESHDANGVPLGVTPNVNGGLFDVRGTLTLGANAVLQNSTITSKMMGGAINFTGDGTLNMSDVATTTDASGLTIVSPIIKDCKATNGAALAVKRGNVTFNFNGGRIENCEATNGGVLYVTGKDINNEATDGSANVHGALTTDAYADENVCIVSNCIAKNGGVAYVDGSSSMLNVNGTIDRFAAQNGGAIYSKGGTINLENVISNCSATNGAAIYTDGGSMNLQHVEGANSLITGCEASENGGAVYIKGDGKLDMTDVSLTGDNGIKNCEAKAGGAIYTEGSNPEINISAGEISGNTANSGSGGAVRMQNGGNMAISGTAVISNNKTKGNSARYGGAISLKKGSMIVSGGTFTNNSAQSGNNKAYGGAIYMSAGCELTLSGGTFTGNTAKTDGACVFLAKEQGNDAPAVLKLSGAPVFGTDTNDSTDTTEDDANMVPKNGYKSKKNGQDSVYENNKARQDIFMAEDGTNPQSIVVTGDFVKKNGDYLGDGSIWVWADSYSHYRQLMPFAILGEEVKFAHRDENGELPEGTLDAAHLKAFRNAQDNDATGNATDDYLYGAMAADSASSDESEYVYWTGIAGSRKVILRKVDSTYAPEKDREFKIFQGSSTSPLAEEQSGASGCFYIGMLSYGWYVLEEVEPHKYFYIVVTSSGVYGTVNDSGENIVGGYDTRQEAETVAKESYATLSAASGSTT